jgi:hypothetical protein
MIAVARIVTRRERRRIPQLQNQRARVEGRVFLKVSACACYIYWVHLSINYIENGLLGEEAIYNIHCSSQTWLQVSSEILFFNLLNMRWGKICRAYSFCTLMPSCKVKSILFILICTVTEHEYQISSKYIRSEMMLHAYRSTGIYILHDGTRDKYITTGKQDSSLGSV